MRLYRPRSVAVWPGAPPPAAIALGTATASGLITAGGRDDLVLGVDEPTALNTGPIVSEASLEDVTGDPIIFTASGETHAFKRYLGRVHVRAANVRFENCVFRGGTATPSEGDALATCTHNSVSNAYFQDCEFYPQNPHWNWDSGVTGHDFTLDRCHIHHTTDGVNIFNTTVATPYNSGVVIKQSLIWQLAYWNAATGGVVHADLATHNDAIQHQGGLGTQMLGNAVYGRYARQYAHWVETSTALAEGDITEPFNGVALTSLPGGSPYYGGPFQASTSGGNTIPDTGTGTAATGRYSVGGVKWRQPDGLEGSLAAILFGDNVGPSGNVTVEDSWIYGGEFAVNGGGAANPGLAYEMFFRRNKFDHTQGSPTRSVNTDTTQTINFQRSGSPWAGAITAPTTGPDRNFYFDNNAAITVRT
jgi:hypothetical protein